MADEHESPNWANGAGLSFCGFTLRGTDPPRAVSCATQVHGSDVYVTSGEPGPVEGDGLWTTRPGLAVAVRVADCVPVLMWDPAVPAVAAVHAGWRGTAADIVGAALERGEELGVEPSRVRAAIGPSIGACCFEVGDEVVDGLRGLGLDGDTLGLRAGARGRPHVDLRRVNRALLARRGVQARNIEDVGGCTRCDPVRYESYRRDGPSSGRMRGIIALAVFVLCVAGCGGAEPPTDADVSAIAEEARLAIADGRGEEAEALIRPLLEDRPDDAWLRATLGRALHRQGRYREASVQSRLAVGTDPALWQAAYNLACHHAALGEADTAIRWLQSALSTGRLRDEDVIADPDLAPLEQDHRFAFYAATGVLSRAEEDAIVLLAQPSVHVGELATVSLVSIALNRPLMAPREPVSVRLAVPLPPGLLRPVSRRETFSAGTEAGREYRQRTLHYTFEVLQAGWLPLGPFEVSSGGRSNWTDTALLEVLEAPPAESSEPLAGLEAPEHFFRSPSTDDDRLRESHTARGGELFELDATSSEPVDAPWASGEDAQSRWFRFRAATIETMPPSTPPREGELFRSILVQRGTEGWSHMLELRAPQTAPAE